MKDDEIRARIQQAVDHHARNVQPTPFLAQWIVNQERTEIKLKKKASVSLIFAIVLLLVTATALAAALLSPKEVVEQVAVPLAQGSRQQNYTHEELAELIRTLNENGITLDEGSRIMQAFQAGRGYWERDTIEEICLEAFGRDESQWTLEQSHWFGEMMTAIGAWRHNIWLLPEGDEISQAQAQARAASLLKETYGVELPAESDGAWEVTSAFELVWDDETDTYPRENARWSIWYSKVRNVLAYSVTLDRHGEALDIWRARFMEKINTSSVRAALDDLQDREGTLTSWNVETWAELGELIRDVPVHSRAEWLYRNAGYRLPPAGAVSPENILKIAREETGCGEGFTGWIEDQVICCTDGDAAIYKVNQRIFENPEDVHRAGRYDAVWSLELDCMTGKVLNKKECSYGPDSDGQMAWVPFSLLEKAPEFPSDPEEEKKREAQQARSEKEAEAMERYGEVMYFWPLEVQKDIYGAPCAVPAQDEYGHAFQIAADAILETFGTDALEALGTYQVGLIVHAFEDPENFARQMDWDFLITTDPVFLSDGYRVMFIQRIDWETGDETILDLVADRANLGNG